MIRPLVAVPILAALAVVLLAQTDTAPPVAAVPSLSYKVGAAAPAQEGTNAQGVPPGGQQVDVQQATDAPRDQQQRRANSEYYWSIAGSVATVLSSVVLAAVGIFGLLFIKKQLAAMEESNRNTQKGNELTLDAMSKSNALARDSLTISHRAYVGVIHMPLLPLDRNTPIDYRIKIINAGSTPATIITIETAWYFLEPPAEPTPKAKGVPKDTRSSAMLGPGEETTTRLDKPLHIIEETWADLYAGRKVLYLAGRILYKDVFGEDRETRFCHTFDPSTGFWFYSRTGNWAT